MARMLIREIPKPILPKEWFKEKQDYTECAIFHSILCYMYQVEDALKTFMKKEIYDCLTTKVDYMKRNSKLSESRIFASVGLEIEKSASYVRDNYDKRGF